MPGHELAGVVTRVGAGVTDIQVLTLLLGLVVVSNVDVGQVGDHVGVGVLSDSCQGCGQCDQGEEQVHCTGF